MGRKGRRTNLQSISPRLIEIWVSERTENERFTLTIERLLSEKTRKIQELVWENDKLRGCYSVREITSVSGFKTWWKSCAAWCISLDKCMNLIAESGLNYKHDFAVIHSGLCGMDYPNNIRLKKKTLLWYVKGTKPNRSGIIENVINSTLPDKSLHEMAQSTTEAEYIIKNLTVGENQIVLDPMMGSGTTGKAAMKLKRKFIGIEIDKNKFEIADANLRRHLH